MASALYQELNLPYTSPFIGWEVESTAYDAIIEDIKFHVSQPITFIHRKKALTCESRKKLGVAYPIFQLGTPGIEIHWIHAENNETVQDNWNRRIKRINYDRIIGITSSNFNNSDKYKHKFFRHIQLNNGSIEITKNNKTYTFPTRKRFPNEEEWDIHFYRVQFKVIANSIKILQLLV